MHRRLPLALIHPLADTRPSQTGLRRGFLRRAAPRRPRAARQRARSRRHQLARTSRQGKAKTHSASRAEPSGGGRAIMYIPGWSATVNNLLRKVSAGHGVRRTVAVRRPLRRSRSFAAHRTAAVRRSLGRSRSLRPPGPAALDFASSTFAYHRHPPSANHHQRHRRRQAIFAKPLSSLRTNSNPFSSPNSNPFRRFCTQV